MDVLLHLGAHRCATTTFQSYLWANRTALADGGLTCWTPRRTRDGLMRGMMRHPTFLDQGHEKQAEKSAERIRRELERLTHARQRAVLISEENMIGSMANNIADARLYPLLRKRLARFAPAFGGHTLRIGLCVRSYEDYWTSSLRHLMTFGHARPSLDDLDCLTSQPRRWRTIVRDIATSFPKAEIVVWPFEQFAGNSAGQLRLLYPRSGSYPASGEERRNKGVAVERLNDVLALRGEPRLPDAQIEANGRWMPFDAGQRSQLRAEYRRDLAWLRAGAEGLARFEGSATPQQFLHDGRRTPAFETLNGHRRPAARPDRADDTCMPAYAGVPFGGRLDGFKEGLGRAGAN